MHKDNKKSIFKNSLIKKNVERASFVFIAKLIQKFLAIIFQVFLSRFLNMSDYGLFTTGATITDLLTRFSKVGMGNSIIRFISYYRTHERLSKLKGAISLTLFIPTFIALFFAVILFVFSDPISILFFHDKTGSKVTQFFALSLPFCVFIPMSAAVNRGLKRMELFALIVIFRSTINIVFVTILLALGYGLFGAITGFISSTVISALLGYVLIFRGYLGEAKLLKAKYEIIPILKYSLPIYFSGFMYAILTKMDIVILSYLLTPKSVGMYKPVITLSGLIAFTLTVFNLSFAPTIADLFNKEKIDTLNDIYKTITRWTFIVAMGATIVLVLFSENFLAIFGNKFAEAKLVLICLATFQLGSLSLGSVETILHMSRKQNWVLMNNICMLFLNFLLNIWWIPKFGILGAGFATGTSLCINRLMAFAEANYFLGLNPFDRKIFKPFLSGFICIIIYMLFNTLNVHMFWFLIAIVIGILYFTIIYFLGLSEEDIVILQSVKARLLK
jgi:O-antigen/teichoic acid export membrane protein